MSALLIVETANQINQIKSNRIKSNVTWFLRRGKTGVPGEKPLNPHMTPGPGIEPGTHWWKASALTNAPTLLPRGYHVKHSARICAWRIGIKKSDMRRFISALPVKYETNDGSCCQAEGH